LIFQTYFRHFILYNLTIVSHSLNFWSFLTLKLQVVIPTFIFSLIRYRKIYLTIYFLCLLIFFARNAFTYCWKESVSKKNLYICFVCNFFIFNLMLYLMKRLLIFLSILSNFLFVIFFVFPTVIFWSFWFKMSYFELF